jgi:Tol biopolymer transport system component
VFASKQNGDTLYHIYVMEDNGSNVRRVSNPDYYDRDPRWFPDGQRIVFERDLSRGNGSVFNAEFYIIDADGRNEHRFMENHPTDFYPALSPDGKQVAFLSSRRDDDGISADIYTYHLESGQLTRLTDNLKSGAWSLRMDWSPDGGRIAYEHESADGDHIWVMNAHGGGKKRLSPRARAGMLDIRGGPRWSPSGRYIMYTQHIWKVGKNVFRRVTTRVVIQEVRTRIRRFHHFSIKDTIADGCWMGNDQTVLLPIDREGDAPANYEIYRYDLVSRELTNLTNQPGGDSGPHWISGTLAVFPGGKLTTLWGQLKQVD